MHIITLIKCVPDTEEARYLDPSTGVIDRSEDNVLDEISSRALAWSLELRDSLGGDVTVLTMGPGNTSEAIREALAIGANSSVHVLDEILTGSDAIATSKVLAAALGQMEFDLVVAGTASTDGQGGVVPAMIAECLKLPHLTYLTDAVVTESSVTGKRDAGDVIYEVDAKLPAVVSVTEKIAEPRVPNFRGIFSAKRKPREEIDIAALDIDKATVGLSASAWEVTSTIPRPHRERGEVITDTGDAAAHITEFLSARELI